MKSVGIKMLKNNLSRYLDFVRQGEVVLVTDRDEVIAELRLPTQPLLGRSSPWIGFVEQQARRGALRLPRRKCSRLAPTAPLIDARSRTSSTTCARTAAECRPTSTPASCSRSCSATSTPRAPTSSGPPSSSASARS